MPQIQPEADRIHMVVRVSAEQKPVSTERKYRKRINQLWASEFEQNEQKLTIDWNAKWIFIPFSSNHQAHLMNMHLWNGITGNKRHKYHILINHPLSRETNGSFEYKMRLHPEKYRPKKIHLCLVELYGADKAVFYFFNPTFGVQ